VSGHGQREAALLVDAVNWKDRVIVDVRSEQGRLSAREHQVSVELISEVASLIASCIASGEVLASGDVLSPADTIRRALKRNGLPINPAGETGGEVSRSPRARGLATRCIMAGGQTFPVPYIGRAPRRTKLGADVWPGIHQGPAGGFGKKERRRFSSADAPPNCRN
jgi:hypothetical protein